MKTSFIRGRSMLLHNTKAYQNNVLDKRMTSTRNHSNCSCPITSLKRPQLQFPLINI